MKLEVLLGEHVFDFVEVRDFEVHVYLVVHHLIGLNLKHLQLFSIEYLFLFHFFELSFHLIQAANTFAVHCHDNFLLFLDQFSITHIAFVFIFNEY